MENHAFPQFCINRSILNYSHFLNIVLRCFEKQMAYHHTLISARYTGDTGRVRRMTVTEEAGCSLASLGKLIHQTTFLWQQMKS